MGGVAISRFLVEIETNEFGLLRRSRPEMMLMHTDALLEFGWRMDGNHIAFLVFISWNRGREVSGGRHDLLEGFGIVDADADTTHAFSAMNLDGDLFRS